MTTHGLKWSTHSVHTLTHWLLTHALAQTEKSWIKKFTFFKWSFSWDHKN